MLISTLACHVCAGNGQTGAATNFPPNVVLKYVTLQDGGIHLISRAQVRLPPAMGVLRGTSPAPYEIKSAPARKASNYI